jgi:hypothetical protein
MENNVAQVDHGNVSQTSQPRSEYAPDVMAIVTELAQPLRVSENVTGRGSCHDLNKSNDEESE